MQLPSRHQHLTLLALATVLTSAATLTAFIPESPGAPARRSSTTTGDGSSNNGRAIAFISFRRPVRGNNDLYVLSPDGRKRQLLTRRAWQELTWSPDGRKIAFVSMRDQTYPGNADIYVIGVDGSGERRLTRDPAIDQAPAWSPDGRKIAFHSFRDGHPAVYVMNPDGSDQRKISGDLDGNDPFWLPGGKQITFSSVRDGKLEFYVVGADGSDPHNLTSEWGIDNPRMVARRPEDRLCELA